METNSNFPESKKRKLSTTSFENNGENDATIAAEFAQMKAEGYEMISMSVNEVKQVENIEGEIFAVVLTTITMKIPDGKTEGKSSLVGISGDSGANWKFVNAGNQESFNTMFPKAAGKIKIPAEQPPKPIKD